MLRKNNIFYKFIFGCLCAINCSGQEPKVLSMMSSVNGDQDFNCIECEKVFTKKENLRTHIKSVHTKTECPECFQIFETRGKRDHHVKRVHKQLFFQCSQCNFKSGEKSNLKQHVVSVHDKSHYVVCTICNAKVAKRTLPKHIESVHENVKSFECDKCGHKTNQKSSLDLHIKVKHDGIKNSWKK